MTTASCPVTGHNGSYDPYTNPQRDSPHPVWAHFRDEQPIFRSDVLKGWVFTAYEDVRGALADTELFINSGSTSPVDPPPAEVVAVLDEGLPSDELKSTVSRDGEEHRRIRRFLVSVLTPRRVKKLEERAREIANELIDAFIDKGRADFVDAFAYRFPLSLIVELMATPQSDGERLHDWSTQKFALYWGQMELGEYIDAANAYLDFQRYLLQFVQQRRTKPGDDVISELIQLRLDDERVLTDAEIVGIMMGFVAAGHETTMNFLSLTLLHCLEDPRIWARLVRHPALIAAMLEESLRFDSPAQAVWRKVSRDTVFSGNELKAGDRVLLVLGSANRDSAAFVDADVFSPEAAPDNPHLAFGRGLHACVGAGLARLEGKVALEELTRRLPDLRLGNDFHQSFKPNAVQRFLEHLPVEWTVAQ